MGKKHIGFVFSYNENWIGGSYYVLNIIHALKRLPESIQPKITILSRNKEDFELVQKETNYQSLDYLFFPKNPGLVARGVNKIIRSFTGRDSNLVKTDIKSIDFIYPNYLEAIANKGIPRVYWVPDFQEEFLPHFFSSEQISWRRRHNSDIASKADMVVFSSEDAKSHFLNMFPNFSKRMEVLPFAVTHPLLSNKTFLEIQSEYGLPEKYYFSPNQFWGHKNHLIILKALKSLKVHGVEISVVFSGKEYDYRAPGYFDSLVKFVDENDLKNNVRFLGFIDRVDQLIILKNSFAVIQPSLFEGWSTVVEDAKAQGKFLILSDLKVHREQMKGREAAFFSPENYHELSEHMKTLWSLEVLNGGQENYDQDITKFGEKFLELTNSSF